MVRQRYNNVYVLDEDAVQARTGKERATDARLWFTARMGWSDAVLPALAREHMRYLTPYKGLSRKCIVLDLDNTLWGGVIGEDGIEGIQLGPEAPGNAFVAFQRELERLWHRGILLAICSKNNEADVLPVFDRHPHTVLKLSHFAARRVNWQSKAMNLREIAAELNIGLDSLVFLDDNPAERAAVRAELPQVLTIDLPIDPAHYRTTLLGLDVFETLALTEDDLLRNERYTAQTARREFESQYVESHVPLEVYLADLQLRVEIDRINQQTLPRVAQLTNKTNQFNLTTHRYSEAEILEMQARGFEGFSARVMDRFGDNGVVGVTIVRRDGLVMEIDTFLLSCRVMGRGVETAILSFLATLASQDGLQRLRGWYLPTEKNAPVKDCYRQHGFKLVEQGPGGGELWELDLADAAVPSPPWLSVDAPSSGT
jgi:FkbH-like protein